MVDIKNYSDTEASSPLDLEMGNVVSTILGDEGKSAYNYIKNTSPVSPSDLDVQDFKYINANDRVDPDKFILEHNIKPILRDRVESQLTDLAEYHLRRKETNAIYYDKTTDLYKGLKAGASFLAQDIGCLLYTSPSPRDRTGSRMPSSA